MTSEAFLEHEGETGLTETREDTAIADEPVDVAAAARVSVPDTDIILLSSSRCLKNCSHLCGHSYAQSRRKNREERIRAPLFASSAPSNSGLDPRGTG